ncbi:MAG: hypothetical protein KGJ57_18420 [Sphingomonadales bacterium]|nr:hypothetical protein [Sphingomonadales bacterium]MDE2171375.1 hypothetical protein [Sphingomonadales bacterium]
MRLSKTCVCSTAHLTAYERAAFDKLIASSPQRDGRILVDHVSLSVEPHQFGFAVRLGNLLASAPSRKISRR